MQSRPLSSSIVYPVHVSVTCKTIIIICLAAYVLRGSTTRLESARAGENSVRTEFGIRKLYICFCYDLCLSPSRVLWLLCIRLYVYGCRVDTLDSDISTVILYCVVSCCAVLCCAMLCCVVHCCTLLCCSVPCCAVLCSTVQCMVRAVLCPTVLCGVGVPSSPHPPPPS